MTKAILERIDDVAWRVQQRHAGVVREMHGLRQSHLENIGQTDPSAFVRVAAQSVSLLDADLMALLPAEMRDVASSAGKVVSQLALDTDIDPESDELSAAVRFALKRDIAMFAAALRNDALIYQMALGRTGSPVAARMAVRAHWGPMGNDLTQPDSLGRNIKTTRYLHTTVRMHLLAAYTVGYFSAAVKSGALGFRAQRGAQEALGALTDFPKWATDHMHPNTTWSLEAP